MSDGTRETFDQGGVNISHTYPGQSTSLPESLESRRRKDFTLTRNEECLRHTDIEHKTGVYHYKTFEGCTMLSLLSPAEFEELGHQQPSRALIGVWTTDDEGVDEFIEHTWFVEFMHRIIEVEAPVILTEKIKADHDDQGYPHEHENNANATIFIDIRDTRGFSNNDVIGSFQVKNREIIDGTYRPNDNYVMHCPTSGIAQLPEWLRLVMIKHIKQLIIDIKSPDAALDHESCEPSREKCQGIYTLHKFDVEGGVAFSFLSPADLEELNRLSPNRDPIPCLLPHGILYSVADNKFAENNLFSSLLHDAIAKSPPRVIVGPLAPGFTWALGGGLGDPEWKPCEMLVFLEERTCQTTFQKSLRMILFDQRACTAGRQFATAEDTFGSFQVDVERRCVIPGSYEPFAQGTYQPYSETLGATVLPVGLHSNVVGYFKQLASMILENDNATVPPRMERYVPRNPDAYGGQDHLYAVSVFTSKQNPAANMLTFFKEEDIRKLGYFPSHSAIGLPSFVAPRYLKQNRAFVDFMHYVIKKWGPELMENAICKGVDTQVIILDQRTPLISKCHRHADTDIGYEAKGLAEIPLEDVIGGFSISKMKVEDKPEASLKVAVAYRPNDAYRVCGVNGIVTLPIPLQLALLSELKIERKIDNQETQKATSNSISEQRDVDPDNGTEIDLACQQLATLRASPDHNSHPE